MYSLAWKLNLVEKGVGARDILLPTYEQERRTVAEELLKFDAEYARLFSGRGPPSQSTSSTSNTDDPISARSSQPPSAAIAASSNAPKNAVDAQKFIEVFKKNAFFTSGCGAIYFGNELNAVSGGEVVKKSTHGGVFNPRGCKLVPGQRLVPGKVTRVSDANQVRIQQE